MRFITRASVVITLAAAPLAITEPAQAAVNITIQQTSSNLITATLSGSLNTSMLQAYTSDLTSSQVQSSYGILGFGFGYLTTYRGLDGYWSGPSSWDQVNAVGLAVSQAISWSGDRFLIEGNYGRVSLAPTYVSGAALNGTETFEGTLASLGLSPGTYVYTAGRESVTVAIGESGKGAGGGAVPEPATWGLMIVGFGLVGATLRKRGVAAA
ncbi:MAG: PEP-CTERM sorting domain-containing protein [Proteobacteria bacterium]|nr:PEP-CTERM sorting domain-containing protein [Pseudomonadota bacterium]